MSEIELKIMVKIMGASIGIIVGILVSIDFIITKKKSAYGFMSRALAACFVANSPLVVNLLDLPETSKWAISSFALPSFVITFILGLVISYIFFIKLEKKYKSSIFSREVITIMDLFKEGYGGLKEKSKKLKKMNKKKNIMMINLLWKRFVI